MSDPGVRAAASGLLRAPDRPRVGS
jgi:hypothetical protein